MYLHKTFILLALTSLFEFVSSTITIENIFGGPYLVTGQSYPIDAYRAQRQRERYARNFGPFGENLISASGIIPNISPNDVPQLIIDPQNSKTSFQRRSALRYFRNRR